MFKRIFGFLALAFAFFGTESWACDGPCPPAPSITNTFSPTVTKGTYDFSATGDGKLTVQFDAILTTFTLTVTVNHTIDALDPNVFPAGTVPVTYANGQTDQYDFTGSASGPNGVPRKGVDYRFLITLLLEYFTFQTTHTPAFLHAPGDNIGPPPPIYTENFIEVFSTSPIFDPTMGGTLPGISSVAAFDEPLSETDTFCWMSPTPPNTTFTVGQEIEVSFQLFSSGSCSNNTGTPLRDKTARLSLSTTDTNGNVVFPRRLDKEEGNKFHWDNKDGVNEFDLSTEGLQPGSYRITVFSSKFSPQSRDITLTPSIGMVCLPLGSGVSCF